MNWFGNLKIGQKLSLGLGICLAISLSIGIVAIVRMARMNTEAEMIVARSQGIAALATFNTYARQFRTEECQHIIVTSKEDKDYYESRMATSEAKAENALHQYGASAVDPQDRRNYQFLASAWAQYVAMESTFLPLSRRNDTEEAAKYYNGPMHVQEHVALDKLGEMISWNQQQGTLYSRQAEFAYTSSRWAIIILLLLVVGFGVVITRLISISISKGMGQIVAAASGLASGNINQEVCVETQDEMGQIAQALRLIIDYQKQMAEIAQRVAAGDLTVNVVTQSENDALGASFVDMVKSLRSMILHVTRSASSVRVTAEVLTTAAEQSCDAASQSTQAIQQVATAIQQVAKGATVQTEQITNAATSMQQLTASTNEIAKGAQEQALSIQASLQKLEEMNIAVQGMTQEAQTAAQVATQADETAKIGNEVVQKTVAGMQRIQMAVEASSTKIQDLGRSSQQIGAIVAVIEEIAEQTNLLALNAAIEAARAGEQGRGFAVVADEVRKLAERSAGATKEISGLIAAVQEGTQEVVEAMSQGSSEVERGSQLAQQAGDALESIQSTVRQSRQQFEAIEEALGLIEANAKTVLSQMSNVAAVTEESASFAIQAGDGATQVERLMEGIAAVSEENSAATEEVSASTEEVSAATEEMQAQVGNMAESSKRLLELAADLQEMVSVFKTEQSPEAMDSRAELRLVA